MRKSICELLNLLFILLIILNTSTFAYYPGCIEIQGNYQLQKIRESAFGNPFQMALHPDGSIILGDHNNNRIVRIKDGSVTTLIASDNIKPDLVAVLPDGKVVWTTMDAQIQVYDINTNQSTSVGHPPSPEWVSALATDLEGSIYLATNLSNIYRIEKNAEMKKIAESLTSFDTDIYGNSTICDMDVAKDRTVYVSAFRRVAKVKPGGSEKIIADNLRNGPVSVEVSPDNFVYISDSGSNFIKYDPVTGVSSHLHFDNAAPFGDFLAPTADELIIYEAHYILYKYNMTTHTFTVILSILGNSLAFAADGYNALYFATPSKAGVLDSHIVKLDSKGNMDDIENLTYSYIPSIDVDRKNRLCLATDKGFVRQEAEGTVTTISPNFFDNNWFPPPGHFKLAVGQMVTGTPFLRLRA